MEWVFADPAKRTARGQADALERAAAADLLPRMPAEYTDLLRRSQASWPGRAPGREVTHGVD